MRYPLKALILFIHTYRVYVTISANKLFTSAELLDSLTSLHTFSLHAHCRQVKTIHSAQALAAAIVDANTLNSSAEYLVLGEGSNTIFVEDYPYCVLLNKIKGVCLTQTESEYLLEVGAGENWHDLVVFCIKQGVGGFENLALIPGTVGAAPIQNIGAYGVEIERFIEKVEFFDTKTASIKSLLKEQCGFGYRDSIFKQQDTNHRIITRVFFTLPKIYKVEAGYGPLSHLALTNAQSVFDEVVAIRKSKLPDPKKMGNAGSFFKNPIVDIAHFKALQVKYPDMPSYKVNSNEIKIPAAWLIDQLGFKGKRVGNIACHVSQPLVLINMGGGEGRDLLSLARDIRDKVLHTYSIHLDNEVRLMGKQGLIPL